MNRRFLFRLSLGPAAISIETELPLLRIIGGRAGGEPLLAQLSQVAAREPAHVRHIVAEQPSVSVDADLTVMTVAGPASEWTAQELMFIAYLLLERQLQLRGLVTLHAAAVARDDRAVLLLGKSGAGKTCTALRLCRTHGFALIGNDLCVVGSDGGSAQALAGTTHLRLRLTSVAKAMPELLPLFPTAHADTSDAWRTKIDVSPRHVGVRTATPMAPIEITAVVFVHVDGDYQGLVDRPGADLVQRLDLYENAVRYIRGGSTPWLLERSLSYGPFVPPLDDHRTHARRTATLEQLLARARYVAGSLPDVATHLAGLANTNTDAPHVPTTRRSSPTEAIPEIDSKIGMEEAACPGHRRC